MQITLNSTMYGHLSTADQDAIRLMIGLKLEQHRCMGIGDWWLTRAIKKLSAAAGRDAHGKG